MITNYLNASSIHGCRYLVSGEDRTLPDRILWTLVLVGSLLLCAVLLVEALASGQMVVGPCNY